MKIRKFLFLCLLAVSVLGTAQTSFYTLSGPYEVIARDGVYANTKVGSERDMHMALELALNGDTAQSLSIINAYANAMQRFEGHDAPLCAIQCYWLVRAMTLVGTPESFPKHADMIRRAMLPMMEKFEADSPYANGNWGAIVNRLRMACGIYLRDSTLYRASIDYFLNANDNGSLPRYVSATGQCQETGRDQSHVQLGLQALAETCEMAWQQGDDLYGALDNRLLVGLEYTARYNLGYDVPFYTWKDCTGLYCEWTEPGSMGRGRIRDIYRTPYHHYVERKGLKMPYTSRLLAIQKKAEKEGKIKKNLEADEFSVKGVEEKSRQHRIYAYPAPQGAPLKSDYDVFVRPRNSDVWTRIDTYEARVNAPVANAKHRVSAISYAVVDFEGDMFVRVVTKKKKFSTVCICPDYRGVIADMKNDSTVQFLLFQPENVSIEFDGDITDNLLFFSSHPPIARDKAEREARKQGRKFEYYAPGLYDNDTIKVSSNTTVYLDGGSYFLGTFAIEDVENVSIIGRGIARPKRGYEGCHVYRSRNVLVEGMVVNTCPVGGSDGVTIRDVRSISFPGWGDGLNVFASSNVSYDRVFCRNSDDCTTAYATRKGFEGNTRNVHMQDAVLWADVAHPIFIGIHGNAERGDTIENLLYENIDIIGQMEPQIDYQGCMAINCGDNNIVRNVVFDNIRVEGIGVGETVPGAVTQQGCLFQIKVGYNKKYCLAPGRSVEDVIFRNVRYKGNAPGLSIVSGYDVSRKVRNIVFEGLKINGNLIYDKMKNKPSWYATTDYIPMFVGPQVEGIIFKP